MGDDGDPHGYFADGLGYYGGLHDREYGGCTNTPYREGRRRTEGSM